MSAVPLEQAVRSEAAVKLDLLTQFIRSSEPGAEQAREFAYRAALYRRNQWLLEFTPDGEIRLLQEEQNAASRVYWSVPWTLFLAYVRVARYASLRPSWELRYGAERERERYIDEQAFSLIQRFIDPERERAQPFLADSMGFGGHSVVFVHWNKNAGPVERVPVETMDPTNTQLRIESVPKEVGWKRKRVIEGSQIVYHATDENGRLKYVERRLGMPTWDVLGPTEYNIDPNAKSMDKARYAYHCKRISAGEIYEAFPEARAKLAGFQWSQSIICSTTDQKIRTARNQPTSSNAVKSAVLIDFYMKPSPEFGQPNGLHAVIAVPEFSGGSTIPGGVILAWEDWPWVTLPYFDGAVEIVDKEDYWGTMLFLVNASAQREWNEIMTIAIDNAKRGQSVIMGATSRENVPGAVSAQSIPGLPGGYMVVMGNQLQDIKAIANLGATGQQVELANIIKGIGESTSAARTATSGELATKLVMDASQDKAVLDNAVSNLTRCIIGATLYSVELFRRHWGLKEFQEAMPQFSEGDLKDFLASQPLTTLRLTTKQVALMDDPSAAVTILKILPQFGPEGLKQFPPAYLADLLQLQRRFGESVYDKQQFKARRENTMMRYGKTVLVDVSDDHQAHLDEHQYYDSDHALGMDPGEAKRRFVHKTSHEEALDAELIRKAVRGVRAQLAVAIEAESLKQQATQAMGMQQKPGGPEAPAEEGG